MDQNEITRRIQDASKNKVLDLSGFRLTFSLPPDITTLKYLKSINLYKNLFETIPEEALRYPLLEELNLYRNKIKCIPTTISVLSNLKILNLGSNNIDELPTSLFEMKALEELDLSNNELVTIPPHIKNLVHLRDLKVFRNQLKSVPGEMGDLKQLKKLDLSENQLVNLPSRFSMLKLQFLNVGENPLRFPPIEVVRRGRQAIIEFLKNESSYPPFCYAEGSGLENTLVGLNSTFTIHAITNDRNHRTAGGDSFIITISPKAESKEENQQGVKIDIHKEEQKNEETNGALEEDIFSNEVTHEDQGERAIEKNEDGRVIEKQKDKHGDVKDKEDDTWKEGDNKHDKNKDKEDDTCKEGDYKLDNSKDKEDDNKGKEVKEDDNIGNCDPMDVESPNDSTTCPSKSKNTDSASPHKKRKTRKTTSNTKLKKKKKKGSRRKLSTQITSNTSPCMDTHGSSAPNTPEKEFSHVKLQETLVSNSNALSPLNYLPSTEEVSKLEKSPEAISVSIVDNYDGTYTVNYFVETDGDYLIDISLYGVPIQNSPFTIRVEPDIRNEFKLLQMRLEESIRQREVLEKSVADLQTQLQVERDEKDQLFVKLTESQHMNEKLAQQNGELKDTAIALTSSNKKKKKEISIVKPMSLHKSNSFNQKKEPQDKKSRRRTTNFGTSYDLYGSDSSDVTPLKLSKGKKKADDDSNPHGSHEQTPKKKSKNHEALTNSRRQSIPTPKMSKQESTDDVLVSSPSMGTIETKLPTFKEKLAFWFSRFTGNKANETKKGKTNRKKKKKEEDIEVKEKKKSKKDRSLESSERRSRKYSDVEDSSSRIQSRRDESSEILDKSSKTDPYESEASTKMTHSTSHATMLETKQEDELVESSGQSSKRKK